jgi:hypothetical protein
MQDYRRFSKRYMTGALYVGLSIVFLVIGLIWTRPLYRYMFKGIPYEVEPHAGIEVIHASPHDCLQLYYKYWLFSEFVEGRIPLFSDPYEFATPGHRGFTSQQFPVSLVFSLLRPISPIFAYNSIMLLSFVGCGLFMVMLARSTIKDWYAGVLAGLIFCVMPFRPPQLMAGHPNGVSVMFLPLVLFLIHRGVEGHLWSSLGAGLVFSSIALTDMQLAYFGAMLIAGFGVWRMCVHAISGRVWHDFSAYLKRILSNLLLMAVGSLPGLIYLVYVKLVMLKQSAIHGGGFAGGRIGPAIKDLWDVTVCGERRIYMGPYVIAFAVAGILLPFLLNRKRADRFRVDVLFWGVMALTGVGLSLSLAPPFNHIVDNIPIARLSRTPARAIVITFIALALLSAQALAAFRLWLQRWSYGRVIGIVVSIACMILVISNYWLHGPRGINVLDAASPVYENITTSMEDARILAIPVWPGDSAMSSSLFHHIIKSRAHLVNGYSPVASSAYRDTVYEPLNLINVGQFSKSEWEVARAMGVSHITFHPESFPAPRYVSVFPADLTLARLKESSGLEWIEHQDPIDSFRVRESPVWTSLTSRAISPMTYCVSGYHCGMPGERSVENSLSLAGHIQTGIGGPNPVFYWKGRVLPSGEYTVRLRLRQCASGEGREASALWRVNAINSESSNILSSAEFETRAEVTEFQWFSLPLSIDRAQRVALELTCSDSARFELDIWTIGFSGADSLCVWEAEDLFHAGRTVVADGASGRGVVQLGDADPTQGVVRGPYRFVAAGNYDFSVRFRGESSRGKDEAIATIQLASHLTPEHRRESLLAKIELKAGSDSAVWQESSVRFTVPPQGAILECCLDRLVGGSVEVDRMQLQPSLSP